LNSKLPVDAFSYYLSLGSARSYEAVAAKYQVAKRTVTRTATRENWQERLQAAEKKARERSDERAIETLEDMNSRHLTTMKLVQRKALDALRTMPLVTAMDAVRALAIGVDKERVIRGEPSDRTEVAIEEIIRREYERVMVHEEDDDDEEEEQNDDETEAAAMTISPASQEPDDAEADAPQVQ
jgi:hypothetical protein